jgi:hypothetical protein
MRGHGKLIWTLAIAAVLMATPALAGRDTGVSGTISLAGQNGARLAEGDVVLPYGETAWFDTTVDGRIGRKATVYITVVCLQGNEVVYQNSGARSAGFPLTDLSGQGLEWDGGPASCTATLIYSDESGRGTTILWLDQTAFEVG